MSRDKRHALLAPTTIRARGLPPTDGFADSAEQWFQVGELSAALASVGRGRSVPPYLRAALRKHQDERLHELKDLALVNMVRRQAAKGLPIAAESKAESAFDHPARMLGLSAKAIEARYHAVARKLQKP